jgi:hypothetical protein
LREVWAERGASCCCWEGLIVAVEAVMVPMVSTCFLCCGFALVEGMENGGRRRQEVRRTLGTKKGKCQ